MIVTAERQAFLIVTRAISKHVLKLYQRLTLATAGLGDVFILYHTNTPAPAAVEGAKVETFSDAILTSLNYTPIRKTLVPGSNHFPVLDFYLKHPEYQYIWCIEDDVSFNGNWNDFFGKVSPGLSYDFISSHIRNYSGRPQWFWWDSLKYPGMNIDRGELIKSFNPIYRISARALDYLNASLKNGATGHHEVLMPTLLRMQGFSLADFSDQPNQITPTLSLCTLRTMRWKPVFVLPGTKKNKLYHPVKANITMDQLYVYFIRTLQNKKRYFA